MGPAALQVFAAGDMGLPTCLAPLQLQDAERVAYGDSSGGVQLLLCSARELPPRDLLHSERHRDYVTLHAEHGDWVSRVGAQLCGGDEGAAARAGLASPGPDDRRSAAAASPASKNPAPPPPLAAQLKFVPEVGLVSASLDCSIKTFDLVREKVVQTCDLHAKGVKDFVYCK
jgi:hypothetical protein